MATTSAVGTEVAMSPDLPTDYTDTAFAALSWSVVGRLQSAPPADGSYDVSTFEDITTGEELKEPDIFRAGEGTCNVAYDLDDAGQDVLRSNVGQKVSIRLTMKNGAIFYRTAVIRSFMPTNISVGSFLIAEVGFAFFGRTVVVEPA